VADPTLVVGPAIAHFGWAEYDWDRLARSTMACHLLKCGAQVTGGYFADPGFKEVPDLRNLGFPIVELDADGAFVVIKAAHTGGLVDCRTVKEQLLYEIHDPAASLTPDVITGLSEAEVTEITPNQVRVQGVSGHPRPATLKIMLCFVGGWLGEGEISYAGSSAVARAQASTNPSISTAPAKRSPSYCSTSPSSSHQRWPLNHPPRPYHNPTSASIAHWSAYSSQFAPCASNPETHIIN
jgi:hypothetical protein